MIAQTTQMKILTRPLISHRLKRKYTTSQSLKGKRTQRDPGSHHKSCMQWWELKISAHQRNRSGPNHPRTGRSASLGWWCRMEASTNLQRFSSYFQYLHMNPRRRIAFGDDCEVQLAPRSLQRGSKSTQKNFIVLLWSCMSKKLTERDKIISFYLPRQQLWSYRGSA